MEFDLSLDFNVDNNYEINLNLNEVVVDYVIGDEYMARHCKEINQKQFESLCYIQCTMEEICSVLQVTEKTLNKWCKETYKKYFSQVFKEKRQGGKASLRRTQWQLAEKNPTMAIFLGKQYLGQRDKFENENTNTQRIEIINDLPSDLDED